MKSIQLRLGFSFLCIIVLILIQGIFAYRNIHSITAIQADAYNHQSRIKDLQLQLAQTRLLVFQLLGTLNPAEMDHIRERFDRHRSYLERALPDEGIGLPAIRKNFDTYEQIIAMHYDFRVRTARGLIETTSGALHRELVGQLDVRSNAVLEETGDKIARTYRKSIRLTTGLLVSALTIAAFLAIILTRSLMDRQQAENEIRKLNQDLELRVRKRTAQLEEMNKELQDFVYSVSHDLRAPLRSISGFAQIIDRRYKECLDEQGRHYFDNIITAGRQMGQLIDDLLKFSRLGQKGMSAEPVPLDDVMKTAVKTLSDQIKTTNARVDIPEQMPVVQGDPSLITHVFVNLFENAIKYHKPDEAPHIVVGIEIENRHVVISVTDNGIGIGPEYHEKIFNIFQRLHNQSEYPGTGIGLAAVKKAIQMMGGRVWVESEPGQGSIFTIEIPVATSS